MCVNHSIPVVFDQERYWFPFGKAHDDSNCTPLFMLIRSGDGALTPVIRSKDGSVEAERFRMQLRQTMMESVAMLMNGDGVDNQQWQIMLARHYNVMTSRNDFFNDLSLFQAGKLIT